MLWHIWSILLPFGLKSSAVRQRAFSTSASGFSFVYYLHHCHHLLCFSPLFSGVIESVGGGVWKCVLCLLSPGGFLPSIMSQKVNVANELNLGPSTLLSLRWRLARRWGEKNLEPYKGNGHWCCSTAALPGGGWNSGICSNCPKSRCFIQNIFRTMLSVFWATSWRGLKLVQWYG